MNKAIVLYTSKRGSTKQYAEWIAEDLGCEVTAFSDAKDINLYEYDLVIYGGWIRGSGIVDFDKLMKLADDDILDRMIVFGTGVAIPTAENYAQVWALNIGKIDPRNVHKATLYILDGRYNPAEIKGLDALLMKVAKAVMLSGQTPDAKSDAAEMKNRLENGCDMVDRNNINALVKEARKRMA